MGLKSSKRSFTDSDAVELSSEVRSAEFEVRFDIWMGFVLTLGDALVDVEPFPDVAHVDFAFVRAVHGEAVLLVLNLRLDDIGESCDAVT